MDNLRARVSNNPIVCSATVIEVDSGEFTTIIPFSVAASKSMLSTPTPALAIIFILSAFLIMSAVSFVLLRTTIPSYSWMVFANSSGVILVSTTTSATSLKFSIPFSLIASAINTFIFSP